MSSADSMAKPGDPSDHGSLLFVNGTLMIGLSLHANLDGGEFLEEARTAAKYRIHSIGDRHPGMFEVERGGVAIVGELYRLSDSVLERVIRGEPPGLYVGPVELADGRAVPGVLFDPKRLQPGDRDISEHGGWRAYIASGTGTP